MKSDFFKMYLVILGLFGATFLFALTFTPAFTGAPAEEGPSRLVVNQTPDGVVHINTDPQAVLKLDPWKQPRLSVLAEFHPDRPGERIEIAFFYFTRSKAQSAGPPEVQWSAPGRPWAPLEIAGHELARMSEKVILPLPFELLADWAGFGPELRFILAGQEFRLDRVEVADLRALWDILRSRR